MGTSKSGRAKLCGILAAISVLVAAYFLWARNEKYSEMMKVNTGNTISSLKAYCTAQATLRPSIPKSSYQTSFLSAKMRSLLPPQMQAATSTQTGYQGYYFCDIKNDESGKPFDYARRYGLCAVPCEYGKTGSHTLVIGESGTVLGKDNGGKPVKQYPDPAKDPEWVEMH